MTRIIFILIIVLCISCEEYFVPDIDNQENTLVFEGLLTDQTNRHFVRISRTNAYGDDKDYNEVSGFMVYIEDENGFKMLLPEARPGYYKPDSTVTEVQPGFFNRGITGTKYRMVAKSPEGKMYHSSWEMLQSSAPIDSIYCAYDDKYVMTYESGTGYREKFVPGINILNSLNTMGHSLYFRYEYELVYQGKNIYYNIDGIPQAYYVARPESSMSLKYTALLDANAYNQTEVFNNIVCFLPLENIYHRLVIDSVEFDTLGNAKFEPTRMMYMHRGILTQIEQYSLSQSGFQFWDARHQQGNSTNEIFDPVEIQVVGNITCLNDSNEVVYGYFGASAIWKELRYIKIERDGFLIKPLNHFPKLSKPLVSGLPFDLWVYEFDQL